MTITSLPPGDKDQYKCVFNDVEVPVDYITGAGGETITCTTPERSKLPALVDQNGMLLQTLAFSIKQSNFLNCLSNRNQKVLLFKERHPYNTNNRTSHTRENSRFFTTFPRYDHDIN